MLKYALCTPKWYDALINKEVDNMRRKRVDECLKIQTVLYKTPNVLLLGIKNEGNDTAFIVGEGVSMSVNNQNVPYRWDPYLTIPDGYDALEGDIIGMYFPFESAGLEQAGNDLAMYVNQNMLKYKNIVLIGHSKAGVCLANMAKWLKRKTVMGFVSAPFMGTNITDAKKIKEKLTKAEYMIYRKYYNQHKVDLDIMPNSDFLRNADFSGVKDHVCINVVSECIHVWSFVDIGCKYLNHRLKYKHGDGIVNVVSQEFLTFLYPEVRKIKLDASHANSLKRLFSNKEKYIIE